MYANQLLAGLPEDERQRLTAWLDPVSLPAGHLFHRRAELLRTVYFPDDGVTAVASAMRDGRTIEVATIGREGMVGLSAFLGTAVASTDALVVLPVSAAYGLAVDRFRTEIARRGPLFTAVSRYAAAFLEVVMQTAACNGLHPVEDRCCRWILLTHDRVGRDEFALTHDALAGLLGVRRPTISVVVRGLERAGLLQVSRGRVAVINRAGLESAVCECYRTIRSHLAALSD